MERVVTPGRAREIMGGRLVGAEELAACPILDLQAIREVPPIPFSEQELKRLKEDYLLVLGTDRFRSGEPVTIRNLKKRFGMDPDKSEPCFYNQDWYDHESFIDLPMPCGWQLIREQVFEDSRAVSPEILLGQGRLFPSAITCTYAFFAAWFCLGKRLWEHDFVWCADTDHNGDRIYVGKYHDIDGINKNGFSVHRHLALRPCYGAINSY